MVLTDYPDKALLDNLVYNVDQNVPPPRREAVHVLGYVWGSSVDPLLATAILQETGTESNVDADADAVDPDASKFDLIILSDLIFNHSQVRHHHYPSQSSSSLPIFLHLLRRSFVINKINISDEKKHRALLTTCERTIAPSGCVLVFYTHHRPRLAHRDMVFFEMASEMRWECEKVLTERFPVRVFSWSFVRIISFAIHLISFSYSS